ncbi:MAG: amidohydrolase family protein [Candidatus Fimisoma sp.]
MKHAYINGVILDGSKDMEPVEGKMILTDGEKIIAIEAQKDVPAGYETVDLKGRYIMPGLVNMHVHLPGNGKPTDKQEDNSAKVKKLTSNALFRYLVRVMCQNYAKTQLMSGVTTLRTMGGVMAVDSAVRDRINTGKAVGPRILAANMAVSVEGGHMAGSLACIAHSADEAAQLVENIAKDNPDLIKLMITGGVLDAKVKGEPGELKMPPEYVKAACDKAHDLGMKVAAHVESPEGVRVALENGVDTIEHGAKPDDEIMRLFKERGACNIATFSPALPFAKFDREVTHMSEMEQYNGQVVFEGIIECAKRCLEEGVPVGLGTDTGCPYITQYDMWRELNYFHKFCGVSNAFALYTATKLNAQLAGVGDITGSIEEGKCADFIVTTKNPLEDLTVLRNVDMVVARGKIINNPKVKRMAEVDKELDKFI